MAREDLAPTADQHSLAVEIVRRAAAAEAAAIAALRTAIGGQRQAAHAHHQGRRATDDAVTEAALHRLGQNRAEKLRLRTAGIDLQGAHIDSDAADPVEVLRRGRDAEHDPGQEAERGREAGDAHEVRLPTRRRRPRRTCRHRAS